MTACPAFALRQPFHYNSAKPDPCASEQFNYTQHLCLPIVNEQTCFGVLFLGAYGQEMWDTEEMHLFDMLAQSAGVALQRRGLFEKLEEKISDLKFSFEVGAGGARNLWRIQRRASKKPRSVFLIASSRF